MQITSSSVRLVNAETKQFVAEWRPSDDRKISVANCNNDQVVCAVGCELHYLEIDPGRLKPVRCVD